MFVRKVNICIFNTLGSRVASLGEKQGRISTLPITSSEINVLYLQIRWCSSKSGKWKMEVGMVVIWFFGARKSFGVLFFQNGNFVCKLVCDMWMSLNLKSTLCTFSYDAYLVKSYIAIPIKFLVVLVRNKIPTNLIQPYYFHISAKSSTN